MSESVDILVVAAMIEETQAVASLSRELSDVHTPFVGAGTGEGANASGTVRAQVGVIDADATSHTIALITTGVGTASASAVASWAAHTFSPRSIVSVGSCGGLASTIEVGTVAVGSSYSYSIAEATAFGYAPGQVPGAPILFGDAGSRARAKEIVAAVQASGLKAVSGLMLSGDAFVTADIAEPMRAKFPAAISSDMETTAHAHLAHLLGIPFTAVRAVSDLCSPRANEEFHIGLDVAAAHSARALVAALPLLVNPR